LGITIEIEYENEQGEELIKTEIREPSLAEVMLDQDFLVEAKLSNELLGKFMTREKILMIIDYLIIEPGFDDDA
jgi:hypothetical protein